MYIYIYIYFAVNVIQIGRIRKVMKERVDTTHAITRDHVCGIALKTIKIVLLFHVVVLTPSQHSEYGL